jgi:hypothetical protein
LLEADLPEADRIVRLAFGTFLGIPDPASFMGDASFAHSFSHMLDAIESLARKRNAAKVMTGVNLARREAYGKLRDHGFRVEMLGVAMETGKASAGYNHAGVYILDDWR